MGKAFITEYTYDCELAFNASNGKSTDILPTTIKYVIINHDFENSIMPVIYVKLNLLPSVYNSMVVDQGKGKMYFKLYRSKKKGSTSTSPKKVIYDEFDYFMTDDPNAFRKLDTIGEDRGTSFKECFIGLIKIDLQTKNSRTFEGVFKNTNSMSLVQSATSNMKMVIQPFVHNTEFKKLVCPKVTSIGQFIAFLNHKASFYNGNYTYYMDFDKTYLRSNDGSYIDIKDGDYKYIAIDVRDLTANQALTTGMVEDADQDAYIIYVPGSDAQIIIDRVTSSMLGNVEVTAAKDGTSVDTASINTKNITNIGTNESTLVYISDDPNAASNIATKVAEKSDTLMITKIDMDSRVFTLNKQYLLCNYEDNPKYCGIYYMTNKQEIYLRNGAQMSCQMSITLRKTADFTSKK